MTTPTKDPERMAEVGRLIAEGYSNKEAAARMGVAEATIKVQLRPLLKRHRLRNRTQLAVFLKTGTRPQSAPAT